MNSESVHLIYLDPPFKKGRDFHATPDSLASGASFQDRWRWEKDVYESWTDQLEDDWPNVMRVIRMARESFGDDMGAYLCFMGVRLIAMHRILREDGSLYLHCDPTASHYLKMLLDAIFGKKNFRNELVWCYTGPSNVKSNFPRKHDLIFYYVKSTNVLFHWEAIRIPYSEQFLNRRRYSEGKSGIMAGYSTGRTVEEVDTQSGSGKIPEDWWSDIRSGGQISRNEHTGYPTQKPLALLDRIIKASSNEGDIVLDPFAGCATTCVAAEKLNRQWVGIDIWNEAHRLVIDRLKKERLIDPEGDRGDHLFTEGQIHYSTTPPVRTDDGEVAVAFLKTKIQIHEPPGPKMSRKQMIEILIEKSKMKCQGCDRTFDDARYLELDHNAPRADGGINHISNRVLLCGPCNKLKSNQLTLSALRKQNKTRGFMVGAT